jgi:uncharacterized membrane protein
MLYGFPSNNRGMWVKDLDNVLLKILKPPRDIVFIICISLLFLGVYLLLPNLIWLRTLVGLPLLFVIPGLLFLEITNYQIDPNNRPLHLAISIAFSILLASGLAIFLSIFHRFFALSFIISLSVLIWMEVGILYIKRMKQNLDNNEYGNIFSMKKPKKGDAILVIGIAFVLIISSTLLAFGVPEEKAIGTGFYLLDSNKQGSDYPTHLVPNQEGEVILVIICQEIQKTNYNVNIWLETKNEPLIPVENFSVSLNPGDKDERFFSFNISTYGLFRIVFQLSINNNISEELYLWVDVSETLMEVTLPGTIGTGSIIDPINLSLNITYDMMINITSHELNLTSYFISVALGNDTDPPQNNLLNQWVDQNYSYQLDRTTNLLINQTLSPNQITNISFEFFIPESGIYYISIINSYQEWPYDISNEAILWIQIS